jgi:pimeloyl-ACP methyl ester carboxylesterase
MAWPQATDYSAAIQNPSACFADADLARGVVATTDLLLGLPLSYSGNFATVYKILGPNEQPWAVKCFTRRVADLQERYRLISQHLETNRKRFIVEFNYLQEGIHVRGEWYPVLKMRWVEGHTLNGFLREHAGHPAALEQLAQLWLRLAVEMREVTIAHGDLQHGNVMLVPGRSPGAMVLRLVDYDGMWVPDLARRPPGEVGHPNYQHPERILWGGFHHEIDRFSHLVIYTALRALRIGGKALWDRYDNGENLLFREADFQQPRQSKLFAELLAYPDRQVQALVGHLLDASRATLNQVPLLAELVESMSVKPLSSSQLNRLGEQVPVTRLVWATPPVELATTSVYQAVEIPLLDAVAAEDTEVLAQTVTETKIDAPFTPIVATKPKTDWRQLLLGIGSVVALLVGTAWLMSPAKPRSRPHTLRPTPKLAPISPVFVRAGRSTEVRVEIEPPPSRSLRVQLVGLPEGVTSEPIDLAEETPSATLKLVSTIDATPGPTNSTVLLLDGDDELHEQRISLTIQPFQRPRIQSLTPSPIVLFPGKSQTLVARVEANGNQDRWVLRMTPEKPLDGIEQNDTPSVLLARNEVGVDLLPRTDVPVGQSQIVRVSLLVEGLECDHRLISLSLEKPARDLAVDLMLPNELHLRAGGRAKLEVNLLRREYDGPVRLKLLDAPSGVTARTVVVPTKGETAEMLLEATPEAGGRLELNQVRIVAQVGDKSVGQRSLIVRLEKLDPLTRATPPFPEIVKIPTADSLNLVGMFYGSNLRKKAPCVLMFHDLSRSANRSDPAWVRLAKQFQKLGCAVLTIDFRGYGDSAKERIDREFWDHPMNRNLKAHLAKKNITRTTSLNAQEWADYSAYLPWLVQDIVAARLWLDLKNDDGEVNSRNLLIVGAGQASQLALLWLATENQRAKKQEFVFPAAPPEGLDVFAGVWLDAGTERGPLFGQSQVHQRLLYTTSFPPMLCVYDKNVSGSVNGAQMLDLALRLKRTKFDARANDGPGVSGMQLLGEKGIDQSVVEYVEEQITKLATRPWTNRQVTLNTYQWTPSDGTAKRNTRKPIVAKESGSKVPKVLPLHEWGYKEPAK